MSKEKQIREMAEVLLKLTYDLRTNMTSITRYVRHEKSKSPTLTEGQFIDRHLEYRELAKVAVDNILKCINDNEELSQIEKMCFEKVYRKQSVGVANIATTTGEWEKRVFIIFDSEMLGYRCSECNTTWNVPTPFCPNCGAKMKGGAE